MRRIAFAAIAAIGLVTAALAANVFLTVTGENVGMQIASWLNASNQALPVSVANPLPVSIGTAAAGSGVAGFPAAATPITGNATGAGAAVVGTLAAAAGKFTYICGFNASAIGGAATIGPITVAGIVGSSQVYQVPVNSAAGAIVVTQTFSPCIPSSAVATAITVTTTADATSTATDVNSWGFQQ